MKYKSIIKLVFCLIPFLLSCEKNDNADIIDIPEGEEKVVGVSLMSANIEKRADSDDPDFEIECIRILAFHSVTGGLRYNSGKIDLNSSPLPFRFEIMTGKYDFVFIANESSVSGNALTLSLDQWTPQSGKVITMLDDETFHYDAFNRNKSLPATSIYQNVTVLGDNDLIYYDTKTNAWIQTGNQINPLWDVEVERLAVRLDIDLIVDEALTDKMTEIRFANLPDKVAFFESKIADNSTICYESGYPQTYSQSSISINDFTKSGPDSEGMYTYHYDRIILPASVFAETDNESKGVTVEVHVSSEPDKPYKGIIGKEIPADYTSPRNIYYKIAGTLMPGSSEYNNFFNLIAAEWSGQTLSGNTGKQRLNVDRIRANISADETTRIHFWSDQQYVMVDETGYTGSSGTTEYNINDLLNGLTGNAAVNLYYNYTSGWGYLDIIVNDNIDLSALGFDKLRIYLNADGLRREIILNIKK